MTASSTRLSAIAAAFLVGGAFAGVAGATFTLAITPLPPTDA